MECSKLNHWYLSKDGVGHYAINSFLLSRMTREKYVKMYERFINQLWMHTKVIWVHLKESKLHKSLGEVKKAIQITISDYDIVIKWLHLYYDMKLVTYSIDEDRNFIGQFSVFLQPYTQQQLILYQIETVPVQIIDQNK